MVKLSDDLAKLRFIMKKILLVFFITFSIVLSANAFQYGYAPNGFKYVIHQHSESSYQHAWCSAHKGIEEYENQDKTRVDCLTEYHAVEFDYANKWAESIGQALHYQLMTGKKAMVVLILEEPEKEMVYFNRVKKLGKIHGFDVEYVTNDILNLDENGKCPYADCKCHKKKNRK